MPNINNSIIDFNDFNAEPQLLRDIQDGKAIAFYSFAHLLLNADGTPYTMSKGVQLSGNYDTLSALKAAFPNGNSNLYIVNEDSKIYYWNGADWVVGGEINVTYASTLELDSPSESTSGTLTSTQLNTLKSNTFTQIKLGNFIYRKEAVIDTNAIYRCITNDSLYIITVNMGTGSWVKTTQELPEQVWTVDDIPDNSISVQKLIGNERLTTALTSNKMTINPSTSNLTKGFYKIQDGNIVLDTTSYPYNDFKCIKIEKPALINYLHYRTGTGELITNFFYAFGKNTRTNEIIHLTSSNIEYDVSFDISNCDELYFNFFGGDFLNEYELFADYFINDVYIISDKTISTQSGAWSSNGQLYKLVEHTDFNCSNKFNLNGKSIKIEYEIFGDTEIGVNVCYYTDKNNVVHSLGSKAVGKHSASADGVYEIVFNLSRKARLKSGLFPEEIKLTILPPKAQESTDLFLYQNYNIASVKKHIGTIAHFVGDSITQGYTSGTDITENNYCKKVSDYFNWSFVNLAQGGAKFVDRNEGILTMQQQMENDTNKEQVDFLFIAGGTNDCASKADTASFKTAVENSITYALTNYPKAQIIYITPINSYAQDRNTNDMNIYRQIISSCVMLSNNPRLSIIQGYNINLPNDSNDLWFNEQVLNPSDKTHPTELGYAIYAQCLIDILV